VIIVAGTFDMAPADRGRYLDSKEARVATTRNETGCIEYGFSADAYEAGRVRLIERWETMDDLAAHVRGMQAPSPSDGPPVVVEASDVIVYEASPVRPPWA